MTEHPTPDDVLNATTPQVKLLITEILKLEKEYQHFRDLKAAGKENELTDWIVRLIEREIKK